MNVETEHAAPPGQSQASTHPHFHPKRKSLRRKWFEAVMALLLVAIGMVIGGGIAVVYLNRHRPRPPRPKAIVENILRGMDETLNLTDGERKAIEEIATRRMDVVDSIRRSSFQGIRGEFLAMSDEFDGVLGKERSDLWEAELQRKFGDRAWMQSRLEHRRKKHALSGNDVSRHGD